MVTWPAVEWPPQMDQYLIDLGYFTLSLALCLSLPLSLSPAEMKRAILAL